MCAGMDEILRDFLVESQENLEQLDQDLISLESRPGDKALLASMFRTLHTIKGTSSFLGFHKLEELGHAGESMLAVLRSGARELDGDFVGALLELIDAIRFLLDSIERHGDEGRRSHAGLIAKLAGFTPSDSAGKDPPRENGAVAPIGQLLVAAGRSTPEQVEDALRQQAEGDPRHVGEILVERGQLHADEIRQLLEQQGAERSTLAMHTTLRVDVTRIDRLMNLSGELAQVRDRLLEASAQDDRMKLTQGLKELNLLASELSECVLTMRMQPVSTIWNTLPRVLRELAPHASHKPELEMSGVQTMLDKSLLDAIKDPLLHLLRNSLDHGIESAETRVAAGKCAAGRIRLRARREGRNVLIELEDDGRGVDPDAVRRTALAARLLSPGAAAAMSLVELQQLLFLPGFSTSREVTRLSGRGVGLDVVRNNIERIGGTVELRSTPGKGTRVRIRVPRMLDVMSALLVRIEGDLLALPRGCVIEWSGPGTCPTADLVRLDEGALLLRHQGNEVPLLLATDDVDPMVRVSRSGVCVVLLRVGERTCGLLVDSVSGYEDLVVRPLPVGMKASGLVAAVSKRMDGELVLILDVERLHLGKRYATAKGAALVERANLGG